MSAAKATASAYAVDEKRRAHEPSMEEILASIRRIISDDQNTRFDDAPSRHEPAYDDETISEAADPQAYDQSAAEDIHPDPVEERRDNILRQLKASSEAQSRGAFRQAAEILETAEFDLPPIAPPVMSSLTPPVMAPSSVRPTAPSATPRPVAEPASPLVSPTTAASIAAQFETLAATRIFGDAARMDELVRELLRPMLREWLDDNLPGIVEKLVRAEIERVARGGSA
jgi:cell pole-organizing protein PopZ